MTDKDESAQMKRSMKVNSDDNEDEKDDERNREVEISQMKMNMKS